MFCYKCGTRLMGNALFCHACGTKISIHNEIDEIALEEEDEIDDEEYANTKGNEEYTIRRFFYTFGSKNYYGSRVYVWGIDELPTAIQGNFSRYYDYNNELAILLFNYSNNAEQGFVITTHNFVWCYKYKNGNKMCKCSIYDIDRFYLFKKQNMDILVIRKKNGEQAEPMILAGMQSVDLFVSKLNKFIELMKNDQKKIMEDEMDEVLERTDIFITEDKIWKACQEADINSTYCMVGNPIVGTKAEKVRINFEIPNSENIFFIYDSTVLGSCKKGMAFCTSGIYFATDDPGQKHTLCKGTCEWEMLSKLDISYSHGLIYFANLKFNMADEGKKILKLLERLRTKEG